MKWLIAAALLAVPPAYLGFLWLTGGRFVPKLASAPDEFNVQFLPALALSAVAIVVALIAWQRLKPAKIILLAGALNVAWCVFLIYSTIHMWGEH